MRVREGWEHPRANSDLNVLRQVTGQEMYLGQHSQASGQVHLSHAIAHWWILRDEDALGGNSGILASKGHMAALYQDELYELVESRAGVARLQLFGIMFGYARVVIYVEPTADTSYRVDSNTARTALLLNQEPLPWAEWAAEFRDAMPAELRELIEEAAGGASWTDHTNAIRERLKRIRELFQFSRYRPSPAGLHTVDTEHLTSGGRPEEKAEPAEAGRSGGKGGAGGRAGDVYALFLKSGGQDAESTDSDPTPTVFWVSVVDGTRSPGVIEDRAARYLPEQNTLQINRDFRGFEDMVNRWLRAYQGTPGAGAHVQDVIEEWFTQQLIETILGIQSLKDSREWTVEDIARSWSEEALTAAVMPRYHVDQAIKRTLGQRLGSLRELAS